MMRIQAKKLLAYDTDELWGILTGRFILVFDDGEMEVDAGSTLYSSYAWNFHRDYPNTPLLLKHHVNTTLKGHRLTSDTHLELLGDVMWSVYDKYISSQYVEDVVGLREELSEKIYRTTNHMYNDLTYRLEEWVTSLDIVDFIEAMEHERIKEPAMRLEQVTEENFSNMPFMEAGIDEVYKGIEYVLRTPGVLPSNPIADAAQSGLVSMGQIRQCLGPRGFLTDTNSEIFRYPVTRGYARGLRTLYNSMVESRSSAKSLLFSKAPLQQAEYFSRRLQLMSQVVSNLHEGDCGSKEYLRWTVRGAKYGRTGKVERDSDLKFLKGKNYLDENGVLKMIVGDEKYLNGQTINLRSVLHCAHPDIYGICSTCFGALSLSVPKGTNIGHMCATSMTQKSSQNVLSVKHLDGSSGVDDVVISGEDRKYLATGSDESSYMLAPRLIGKRVKIIIDHEKATNITDILAVDAVENLNLSRVSELETIGIVVTDGAREERQVCTVHIGRRLSSMSYDMLKFIAVNRWDVDENGNYVIDMDGWDWNDPILVLPLKHINMSDHSRDIAQMLESRVEDMRSRDKSISPEAFLVEFFDLVNEKLSVNLAVLEVILYGSMIRSAEDYDYALPKPWTSRGLGVMKNSMAYRSLAPAMAYEGHHDIITSPMSYLLTNRVDHPLDNILMPELGVIKG